MRIIDWSSDVCSSDLLALQDAGILLVETMEELIDVSQLLLHFPSPRPGGLGVVTTSGALCALTADYLEGRGLEVPSLSPERRSAERRVGKECVSTCRSRLSPDH